MLEKKGTKVSISTVKLVLYRHNLKCRSARKKPLLQNHHKKARLQFATAHGDKDCTFWRKVLWSDETKIEHYHVVEVLCCRRDWCTSQNRCHHEVGQLRGCIEATLQDISQEVKAWLQMGLPNGQ
jgi:hypothetical protein